jgi:hypothetical protein
MAKARIRSDPALLGKGMATAGLIAGYIALAGSILFLAMKASAHMGISTIIRKESDEIAVMSTRGVDQVLIGEPESESEHSMKYVNSESGVFFGRRWRATPGMGRFSYVMRVMPDKPMVLNCRYWGSDAGARVFDVLVNEKLIATQTLERNVPDRFFDVEYKIPRHLTRGQMEVTVEFRAHAGKSAGGLFACEILRQ